MNKYQYTIAEHHFKTSDKLHTLYVQEWGNPKGRPALFVHGGPGASCKDKHKLIFDPTKYRVIFVDQRGAGHSAPSGSLENNTTDHLIEDFEMIRNKLKIDKWMLVGGSWGSTLSLCYAIKHQDVIDTMLISGIWLGTRAETKWLFGGGWRDLFPDLWEKYLKNTPARYRDNPADYHLSKVFGSDKNLAEKSLFELTNIEYSLLHLDENKVPLSREEFDAEGMNIEMHYLKNNCFIPNGYILDNSHKLSMPIHIIQGRYDMVCPPTNAYELHKNLPNSQMIWSLDGHVFSRGSSDIAKQTLSLI